VEDLLTAEGYVFTAEKFSPWCRRLEYEPHPLGASLAAFFGYIYIQDRSSMLPPLALAPDAGGFALDMCASPGGKSGFLAQLTGSDGFVLANEQSQARLVPLRANLCAANLPQAATSCFPGQALPLPQNFCRHILLDAPCSGWGTAEKHPEVLKLWKTEKTGQLVALQRRLLTKAAGLLAPGGALVYSTCTTNEAENECQLRFAEEELGLARDPLAPFPGFVFEERAGGEGALRVDGEKSGAQGFFVARLKKTASPAPSGNISFRASRPARQGHTRVNHGTGQRLALCSLEGDCCDPARLPPGTAALFGDHVRFLPTKSDALPVDFIWRGMELGRMKSGRFRPAPRLRALLPHPAENGKSLVLEDVSEVRALLDGQSRRTGLSGHEAGLWWRGLPLCLVRLSQGRASAAFGM
jgi:16S rRNA (cytosine1407-C5)-methyltransferase